jgi:pimeloyl-ACP methyl ester carboxylesterase
MKVEVRGAGRPLVYLHAASGVRWTPVLERLSQTHAVHMPSSPDFERAARYVDSIGKPVDVIGSSFGAAVALRLASERPDCVDHLVLASPAYGEDADLLEKLSRVEATTLILHGTEDRSIAKESVQLLKSRLRRAFLVYVWDAGHDIEVDQPGRMLSVVQGFLERSDAFMVNYA